ncbi:glycosyltransferase family 4 protein [Methanocaldococcus sp.]
MDILIVTEYFPSSEECNVKGGVEFRAFYIAKNLVKKHNVYVLTSWEKGLPQKEEICGINVIRCGKQRKYSHCGSFIERLSFIREGIKIGKKLDIDIVDGYNFISYPIAYKISEKLGIPRIATYHDVWIGGEWIKNIGFFGIFGEILERYILSKKWDKFIAVSKYTKEKLIRAGIDKNIIEIVYNGINLEDYQKIKVPKEKNTLCYVGRLVKYKKVDDLIKAVSLIVNDIPDVKLKIIGTGPEKENLEKIVKSLNLKNNVEFLGFIEKHKEVIKHIKSSTIFSLPSIVEGFGIVTIESVASGTPYVNSAIPPTIEITENGKGGLLFEPENVSDLSIKIKMLLEDKNLYFKKQKECLELSKKYNWKILANNVENIYLDILRK